MTSVNRYAENKGPEDLGGIKTPSKNSKLSHHQEKNPELPKLCLHLAVCI